MKLSPRGPITPVFRSNRIQMLNASLIVVTLVASALSVNTARADCAIATAAASDFPDSIVTADGQPGIARAWYDDATDRYAHGVLGDAIEPASLWVSDDSNCSYSVTLDDLHVFEDVAPRLADIDGVDGVEVVTVRSHRNYGAQIAVYQLLERELTLLTTTPYIGQSNRWLAPVGITDLNNDGNMDIAYVDRPHLAKTLRVWTFQDGDLHQIAHAKGHTNHRIGEDFISGGLKTCANPVSLITVDASWRRILETTLQGTSLVSQDVGAFGGAESLADAMRCP